MPPIPPEPPPPIFGTPPTLPGSTPTAIGAPRASGGSEPISASVDKCFWRGMPPAEPGSALSNGKPTDVVRPAGIPPQPSDPPCSALRIAAFPGRRTQLMQQTTASQSPRMAHSPVVRGSSSLTPTRDVDNTDPLRKGADD